MVRGFWMVGEAFTPWGNRWSERDRKLYLFLEKTSKLMRENWRHEISSKPAKSFNVLAHHQPTDPILRKPKCLYFWHSIANIIKLTMPSLQLKSKGVKRIIFTNILFILGHIFRSTLAFHCGRICRAQQLCAKGHRALSNCTPVSELPEWKGFGNVCKAGEAKGECSALEFIRRISHAALLWGRYGMFSLSHVLYKVI